MPAFRDIVRRIDSIRNTQKITKAMQVVAATRYMNEHHAEGQQYVTIGRKGRDSLLRFRRQVIAEVSGVSDRPTVVEILPAITVALEEFTKGNTDAVILCYSKWISTMKQEPVVQVLIPAEIPQRERGAGTGPSADYIYEPDPESVLDGLLPRYVETQVFQAVLENKASEYSAKMIAMQNATEAAGDLIDALTLYANKVRQEKERTNRWRPRNILQATRERLTVMSAR